MNTDYAAIKAALASDGIIAYPTEAVFGLGCDPRSETALTRILDVKGRESHKGFILIAASQEQLSPFIEAVPAQWQAQLDAEWPGPVTFVMPARPASSLQSATASSAASKAAFALLTGGRDTLAVRVSNHPLVVELCTQIGHALVSTSANRSGSPALRSSDEVRQAFGTDIDVVLDGNVGTLDAPTRIIDIRTGQQLR